MKIPNIRVVGDRILLKLDDKAKVSESGIIIPENAKMGKPMQGTVVAVGKGKYYSDFLKPMEVKVGERVMFDNTHGVEIEVEGEKFIIMLESNLYAVLG